MEESKRDTGSLEEDMATYDPREGRGKMRDIFKINIPPDLKITPIIHDVNEPESMPGTMSYSHETPGMGKIDFALHMEEPRILSSDFTLVCNPPEWLPGHSSLKHREPVKLSRTENCDISCSKPLLIFDANHITLHKTVPDIAKGDSSLVVEETVPILLCEKGHSVLEFNLPEMVAVTDPVLEKNTPDLLNKTPMKLEQSIPLIMGGVETSDLEMHEPLLKNRPGELVQNDPLMTENFDKSDLEKNEPLWNPGVTMLTQLIPLIRKGVTLLTWRQPLIRLGVIKLKHRIPLLKKGTVSLTHPKPDCASTVGELSHNLPEFSKTRVSDYFHDIPDCRFAEEIYIHNLPELSEPGGD